MSKPTIIRLTLNSHIHKDGTRTEFRIVVLPEEPKSGSGLWRNPDLEIKEVDALGQVAWRPYHGTDYSPLVTALVRAVRKLHEGGGEIDVGEINVV